MNEWDLILKGISLFKEILMNIGVKYYIMKKVPLFII